CGRQKYEDDYGYYYTVPHYWFFDIW
nr:immunoglobulin heavy chain junction region [Macaca mulatta]MOW99056.1 immunoglobulin heavy chain junction region [Macaca mulatta]MOX00411.1 immunoglobulin heavy chain junction region [Macaca mulatta]MOX01229.1 immunoglobulin heavy chain junction region [Macaca mulatta]MOX01392.1 immunoglobulin heavy chain junction region [Macaca mulatta]